MPSKSAKTKIDGSMTVRSIVTLFPPAAEIMMEYGLHCFSCPLGGAESLAEGASLHQLDNDTFEVLIDDINEAIENDPGKPWSITITPEAARGIRQIAEEEGKKGKRLEVIVDEHGGFCMEFLEEPNEWNQEFGCDAVPDVKICASPLTLQRIGGATIDYRDERFKLDL